MRLIPNRRIEGQSAVLLPIRDDGRPDFETLAQLVRRTADAGLVPAVNMDTGYANLITDEERVEVLKIARQILAGKPFTAGAFVEGRPGDPVPHYLRQVAEIQEHGGTPILFQCTALKGMSGPDVVKVYEAVAKASPRFYAFELGEMFAPFGRIYDLETVRALMGIPACVGMKHSSLSRRQEWDRLDLRDRVRPDFKVYTGNDLAIDMVMYGSDYLLGISAFWPEAFAKRDRWWAEGDARFYELNDLLQYLGFFAFRPPVPAYKHSAAMFLHLRGVIPNDLTHPRAPKRPESDRGVLQDIAERIARMMS